MSPSRRKLLAVDDPLTAGPAPGTIHPPREQRPAAAEETAALYVRLRVAESERLARAAFELRVHKRELVGALIARHVDATNENGRRALMETIEAYRRICR